MLSLAHVSSHLGIVVSLVLFGFHLLLLNYPLPLVSLFLHFVHFLFELLAQEGVQVAESGLLFFLLSLLDGFFFQRFLVVALLSLHPTVQFPIEATELVTCCDVEAVVQRVLLLDLKLLLHLAFDDRLRNLRQVALRFLVLVPLPHVLIVLREAETLVHHSEEVLLLVAVNQVFGELFQDFVGFALLR